MPCIRKSPLLKWAFVQLSAAGRYGSGSEHTPDDHSELACKRTHVPISDPYRNLHFQMQAPVVEMRLIACSWVASTWLGGQMRKPYLYSGRSGSRKPVLYAAALAAGEPKVLRSANFVGPIEG